MEKVVSSLTKIEVSVLKALRGVMSNAEITEKTGLESIAVLRGISWLESKGLVSVKNEVKEIARRTGTGSMYLQSGLPEDRVLGVLAQEGELVYGELAKDAELDSSEFKAAMGILKKAGMIRITSGKVGITEKGKDSLKQENEYVSLIKKMPFEVKRADERLIELKRRGIAVLEIETTKLVSINEKGKRIQSRIGSLETIDRITPTIIKRGEWKEKKIRRYDVRAMVPKRHIGKKQPYLAFLDELKDKLARLGFREMKGPAVETNFWNCDALFMPQDHPARGIHDIYYVKSPKYGKVPEALMKKVGEMHRKGLPSGRGWNYNYSENMARMNVLRSQGTALSARMLANPSLKIPGKYFSIARCFRPDTIDWQHLTEFNQVEGIIIAEGLNMKSLLGVLKMFAEEVVGVKKYRFRPDYYPFTEPSVELSGYKKGFGWVELGGSGIFRPEVTKPFGIDVPVIAWGLGVDRFYMMRENINDIRNLFSSDLEWIRRNA
jgi:phenylalanyl-tRNA synthetase alpha chain